MWCEHLLAYKTLFASDPWRLLSEKRFPPFYMPTLENYYGSWFNADAHIQKLIRM